MKPQPLLAIVSLVLSFGVLITGQAAGQCILANPSFELGGSGGGIFGGWSQFGVVSAVTEASHGNRAARVRGPDQGGWDVSGFWQRLDSQPGEQWEATGKVFHPASLPLTGQSVAIVNIEWRDAGGDLIDYDSFTVADASSPTDEYFSLSLVSGPAPAGTVAAHFLLGVLQSPNDPAPDVYYDQVTLFSTSYPTIDDMQWNDFPGGETVSFAGRSWRVKGPGYYGPGPNLFNDDPDFVWVDGDGRLHLTLQNRNGSWYSTEVTVEDDLGYGDYILTTVGRLDLIDPQVVLGIFLWQYGPCWAEEYLWWNPYNEIDIEYSRWGNPGESIGQFVAQPWYYPGNINRFDATFAEGEMTSHAMRWLPDRVEWRVWRGGPDDESAGNLIHSWTYTGPHISRPEQPRMHLNLWKLEGTPAANQEVVFDDFVFVPASGIADVNDFAGGIPASPAGRLFPAVPNPFNPSTTVRFELARGGFTDLGVYDLTGRLVRSLGSGFRAAGEYRTTWDGLDDGGRSLASGVYLLVLRGSEFVETRRVGLIK